VNRFGIALALLLAAPTVATAQEAAEFPEVTLAEALRRAASLDPNYVAALNEVGDANWRRVAAYSAFITPAVTFQSTSTTFSSDIFNVGTNRLSDRIVDARLSASYDVFRGGGKFFDLWGARAGLRSARANERQARFESALQTESDYYAVVAEGELTRVASGRVRRAEEQLSVARARVVSGAAVQSDSLQLFLELTRAQVDLLRQEANLRVSRYQLGRRIGAVGPVDAAPLDTLPAPSLPVSEADAVSEAMQASPRVVQAQADAAAANSAFKSVWSQYLPSFTFFTQYTGFDESFFPDATERTLWGFSLDIPIWDNAQRELRLSEARTTKAITRALRDDTQRGVARDVVEAYQLYETARAAAQLATTAVVVARENLRVQEERYRAGATTIIDLITAQVDLTDAEAGVVQARQQTRLALAGLEAILGRRLFPDRVAP
jgi:outer membrane protein TolC